MPQPPIVSFLADYGFYEIFLPFILIFAIIFGILQKTHVLGKDKKRANILVALAISLIAIGSLQFLTNLQEFITKLGFAIIILLGLALLLGFFGVPLGSWITLSIGSIAFIIIVFLQFSNPAINKGLAYFLTNGYAIAIFLLMLIIYLLVRSPRAKPTGPETTRGGFPLPKQPAPGAFAPRETLTPEQLQEERIRRGLGWRRRAPEQQQPQPQQQTPQANQQRTPLSEAEQMQLQETLDQSSPQEQEGMLRTFLQQQRQGFQGVPPEERAAREYAIRYLQGRRQRR